MCCLYRSRSKRSSSNNKNRLCVAIKIVPFDRHQKITQFCSEKAKIVVQIHSDHKTTSQ